MTQDLNIFSRAELLLGEEALEKLRSARVALFGIGGVGSFAAEALARGGVGHITLVDGDTVSITNINRQLIALHSTVGKENTAVMAYRRYFAGNRSGNLSRGLWGGKSGFAGFFHL